MTAALWLLAAAVAAVGSTILVAALGRWLDRSLDPALPTAQPSPVVPQLSSVLRLVLVTIVDGGIVLDGIVERGHALGLPGAPVTMLLEQADPCALGAVVRELESWAATDALVDVALIAVHGGPAASLRSGGEALQLQILGVRS